jgi:hypothetical protein
MIPRVERGIWNKSGDEITQEMLSAFRSVHHKHKITSEILELKEGTLCRALLSPRIKDKNPTFEMRFCGRSCGN